MATPRKSDFDKAFARLTRSVTAVLTTNEPTERQLREVEKRWQVIQHWESHETAPDGCPWCEKYPPLSR